jgi:hypothetical protein
MRSMQEKKEERKEDETLHACNTCNAQHSREIVVKSRFFFFWTRQAGLRGADAYREAAAEGDGGDVTLWGEEWERIGCKMWREGRQEAKMENAGDSEQQQHVDRHATDLQQNMNVCVFVSV